MGGGNKSVHSKPQTFGKFLANFNTSDILKEGTVKLPLMSAQIPPTIMLTMD